MHNANGGEDRVKIEVRIYVLFVYYKYKLAEYGIGCSYINK